MDPHQLHITTLQSLEFAQSVGKLEKGAMPPSSQMYISTNNYTRKCVPEPNSKVSDIFKLDGCDLISENYSSNLLDISDICQLDGCDSISEQSNPLVSSLIHFTSNANSIVESPDNSVLQNAMSPDLATTSNEPQKIPVLVTTRIQNERTIRPRIVKSINLQKDKLPVIGAMNCRSLFPKIKNVIGRLTLS